MQPEKIQRRVGALLDGNETSAAAERARGEFLNSRLFVERLRKRSGTLRFRIE